MQISLIVLNIWNPHRDMAEIIKLFELGMRLLSNPNKCGYGLFILNIGCLKLCAVGAFLACKLCFCTYFTYFTVNL